MKKPRVEGPGRLLLGLLILVLFGRHIDAATLSWRQNPDSENILFYTVYLESSLGSTQVNLTGTNFPLDALARGVPYTLRVTATSDANLESVAATTNFFAPLGVGITTQPESRFVAVGDTLELSVEVSGSPPFFFQWLRYGIPLPAQTNQALFISSVTTAQAGHYSVLVTNAAGVAVSSPATVTILTRPLILLQPASVALNTGARLQLGVTASGSDPLSYQWFREGQAIPGAQSDIYEVLAASSADAGTYIVQVTNSVGSAQSLPALVTIQARPAITAQPQSITVSQDSQVALAVVAAGSPPLSYQWYKAGVPLLLQTAPSLIIARSLPSDAGTYTVRVTNPFGSIDSDPATITVQTANIGPTIVTQPRSVTLAVGGEVNLEVIAAGTAPLHYQWLKDGSELVDETNSTFAITDVVVTNSGSYSVVVSNSVGSITSAPGVVTVMIPPSITTHPASTNLVAGGTLTLSVEATGTAPLTYQWYHLGRLVVGATQKTLRIPFVTTENAGPYLVIISNGGGAASSTAASVTVSSAAGNPPIIVAHPQPLSLNEGDTGALSVQAEAQDPLQFHWFKNGEPLAGKTNEVLDFGGATQADAGEYTVRVSNWYGSVTSDPATLSVLPVPRILWHPNSVAVRVGSSFQLAAGAASAESLSYQWLKDGVAIPGATEATYQVISAQAEHAGTYRVKISNSFTFVLSHEATVTIAVAPQITQQPSSITANEGGLLRLSFQASGTGPFVVEWLRDSALVQVTSSPELAIANATASDAGTYVARVTGPGGSVQTLPVTVRIETRPTITTQPQSAIVQIGATVFLAVSATGNGTLTYQWFRDGQPITGATNLFLLLTVRNESDFGRYTARVSNAAGFTESEPAFVQSSTPPKILAQPQSIDVLIGTAFSLAVDVRGAFPYTYQWFRNGAALAGANSAGLNVSAAALTDAGAYHVVITNDFGSVRSSNATVRIIPHILITRNLADTNVALGSELTLSILASSELPLSYLWFRNDEELEGQNTAVLRIPQVSNADAGSYHVLISNELEEIQSDTAQVAVVLDPDAAAGRLVISATAGGLNLYGQGLPNATYDAQLCGDLSSDNWITIQTVAADSTGRFEINAPASGIQWYIRTVRR